MSALDTLYYTIYITECYAGNAVKAEGYYTSCLKTTTGTGDE